jgi:hypothetical protein
MRGVPVAEQRLHRFRWVPVIRPVQPQIDPDLTKRSGRSLKFIPDTHRLMLVQGDRAYPFVTLNLCRFESGVQA